MKPLLALLVLIALAAPAVAFSASPRRDSDRDGLVSATADRHPGVYAFRPMRPGACAARQRERQIAPRPVRPQRLGDLPPAYVIRLADRQAAAWPLLGLAQPQFDPCALLERVK